jgi:hypothetical protein
MVNIVTLLAFTISNVEFSGFCCLCTDSIGTITATNWSITSRGYDLAQWRMKSTAGDKGTFVTLGDASNYCDDFLIEGIGFYMDNVADITASAGPALNVFKARRGKLSRLRGNSTPQFVKFGSATSSCSAINMDFVKVAGYKALATSLVNVQGLSGSSFTEVRLGAGAEVAMQFCWFQLCTPCWW